MLKLPKLSVQKSIRLIALTLFIPSMLIAICSVVQPTVTVTKSVENRINQITTIQCRATIKPCALYPDGAVLDLDGPLIAKITDKIEFIITSRITSDKPVHVSGTGKAYVTVSALDVWKQDFIATDGVTFEYDDSKADLFTTKITVKMDDFRNYIKEIEAQTDIIKELYTVEIRPDIAGEIRYGENEFPLEPVSAMAFTYNGTSLEPNASGDAVMDASTDASGDASAEAPPISPRQTVSAYPVESTVTAVNMLWGANIPVSVARLVFIPLFLLSACVIGYGPAVRMLKNGAHMPQAVKINRKYKNRISHVVELPKTIGKASLEFQSFHELVRLADQKELPILYHDEEGGAAVYFLIDAAAIYCYKAGNTPPEVRRKAPERRPAGRAGSTNVR